MDEFLKLNADDKLDEDDLVDEIVDEDRRIMMILDVDVNEVVDRNVGKVVDAESEYYCQR